MPRWIAAWLLGSTLATAVPGDILACGPVSDCIVEQGSYRALPPSGWDGRSPLPTTVFFHGYQGSGADMLADARIARPLAAHGFLLVAPDGLGKSWSHQGSPSQLRDEHRFVDAVLADAEARWPIDRSRLLAVGFSQGGSMVWDLACRRQPQAMRHEGTLVCGAWTGCASGRGLELCLFDGGHEIPAKWVETTLRWLGQLGS